jgi:hypothetical protein
LFVCFGIGSRGQARAAAWATPKLKGRRRNQSAAPMPELNCRDSASARRGRDAVWVLVGQIFWPWAILPWRSRPGRLVHHHFADCSHLHVNTGDIPRNTPWRSASLRGSYCGKQMLTISGCDPSGIMIFLLPPIQASSVPGSQVERTQCPRDICLIKAIRIISNACSLGRDEQLQGLGATATQRTTN